MPSATLLIPKLLDELELFYGKQAPSWPTDAYEFLLWWQCGYPASEAACTRGWERLKSDVGIAPNKLLRAPPLKLSSALRAGGMLPEQRALRVKEIAMSVEDEFHGDLRTALNGPVPAARKILKKFPGIADPGADRILLFAGVAPIAAVPSNCPQVLIRMLFGQEHGNYNATYREAQKAIASEVAETIGARQRAYLLLKRHGEETCKRNRPRCELCPVSSHCAFVKARR
jgi:endonuclease III